MTSCPANKKRKRQGLQKIKRFVKISSVNKILNVD